MIATIPWRSPVITVPLTPNPSAISRLITHVNSHKSTIRFTHYSKMKTFPKSKQHQVHRVIHLSLRQIPVRTNLRKRSTAQHSTKTFNSLSHMRLRSRPVPLRRMKLVHGSRSGRLRSKLLEYQSRSLPHRSQVRKVQLFTVHLKTSPRVTSWLQKDIPHHTKIK